MDYQSMSQRRQGGNKELFRSKGAPIVLPFLNYDFIEIGIEESTNTCRLYRRFNLTGSCYHRGADSQSTALRFIKQYGVGGIQR